MKIALVLVLVSVVAVAIARHGPWYVLVHSSQQSDRTYATAYFDNSNGVFVGDNILIRGFTVGKIDRIEPEPTRVKVSFWLDKKYPVPANVNAVILSPTLVTARAIQLTPPYSGGPTLADNAVIPQQRTAVPMEWDDMRNQLQRLTAALQPTEPGGVSTLGALIHTTAENLRGQGANIRNAIIKLSQTISALGDHSGDIFTSVKNTSMLVSALQDSTQLVSDLNIHLASVTGLLANNPGEIGEALKDLDGVADDVKSFVADNREALGTTSDKMASVSTALANSLDDIKQLLHVLPSTAQNAVNLYQPAQGTLTGIAAINNFADPITFICGAIQAASRLGAEQSAKLCVQYLAPIIKNRQYNFLPLGENLFVGASARPNEVTYSEDWMRPDYIPPQPPSANPSALADAAPSAPIPPIPGDAPGRATDPAAGLSGIMVPTGGGQ